MSEFKYRPNVIKLTWYDSFTGKELGTTIMKYDPERMLHGFYRKIAIAWKEAAPIYRRAGLLIGNIKTKVNFHI